MYPQPNRLAERRRGAVRERHEPRLGRARGKRERGDARAEGEALEGLVERDGDEEDEEGRARGDGDGHADEDAVEEDAGLEQEALQQLFFLLLLRREERGRVPRFRVGRVRRVGEGAERVAALAAAIVLARGRAVEEARGGGGGGGAAGVELGELEVRVRVRVGFGPVDGLRLGLFVYDVGSWRRCWGTDGWGDAGHQVVRLGVVSQHNVRRPVVWPQAALLEPVEARVPAVTPGSPVTQSIHLKVPMYMPVAVSVNFSPSA